MTETESTSSSEQAQTKKERGIPQQQIMDLLQEASILARSNDPKDLIRLGAIQFSLVEPADLENPDPNINSATRLVQNEGIDNFVNYLFVEAAQNNPEAIPTLFPIFAAISGSREGRGFAKVDWAIAKQPFSKQTIGEIKPVLGQNST